MGIKVKKTILLVAFFCSCVPQFSNSSDHLQKIMKYETICGPGKLGFSHGGRGGGGGHSKDGGAQSSYPQGGSSMMPLYTAGAAAGAANDYHGHHQNHSRANHKYNCVEVVTLSCTMLACLLLRQGM